MLPAVVYYVGGLYWPWDGHILGVAHAPSGTVVDPLEFGYRSIHSGQEHLLCQCSSYLNKPFTLVHLRSKLARPNTVPMYPYVQNISTNSHQT